MHAISSVFLPLPRDGQVVNPGERARRWHFIRRQYVDAIAAPQPFSAFTSLEVRDFGERVGGVELAVIRALVPFQPTSRPCMLVVRPADALSQETHDLVVVDDVEVPIELADSEKVRRRFEDDDVVAPAPNLAELTRRRDRDRGDQFARRLRLDELERRDERRPGCHAVIDDEVAAHLRPEGFPRVDRVGLQGCRSRVVP